MWNWKSPVLSSMLLAWLYNDKGKSINVHVEHMKHSKTCNRIWGKKSEVCGGKKIPKEKEAKEKNTCVQLQGQLVPHRVSPFCKKTMETNVSCWHSLPMNSWTTQISWRYPNSMVSDQKRTWSWICSQSFSEYCRSKNISLHYFQTKFDFCSMRQAAWGAATVSSKPCLSNSLCCEKALNCPVLWWALKIKGWMNHNFKCSSQCAASVPNYSFVINS